MSLELQYLIFATFLLLIQMLTQLGAGIFQNGLNAAAGSRDDEYLTSGIGGRFERAYYNMIETFPIFAALVLIIEVAIANQLMDRNTTSVLAVQLYFWGRVAYIPAYIISIPYVRSVVWVVSMIGIMLLAWPLLQQVT